MSHTKAAVGIDLGATKCCVAVVRNGNVEVVENERGSKTTPSYVAFTKTERLVGDDALDQITFNPANTVSGIKGLIGRNYDQIKTYCKENYMPFEVVQVCEKPRIQVNYKGQERLFSPEQIVAMLLSKMKALAETHLGCQVTEAVISVPAYFNNSQRLATKAAAEIAGLKVLRLINEPTAAAISFASNRRHKEPENVMIVDGGGGHFEASFMSISDEFVDVKSTQGDCHFGGQSLDVCLLKHFLDEVENKHCTDISWNKRAVERLRIACNAAKKTLSQLCSAVVQVDGLIEDIDFESSISRQTFNSLCDSMIPECLIPVLINAGLKVEREIDHVVFIGGSSRVSVLQEAVTDFFKKDLTKTINVNEAVAFGAALHAGLLLGENVSPKVNIKDITAHSIDLIPPTGAPVTVVRNDASIPFQNKIQGTNEGETTLFEFVSHSKDSKKEYNMLGDLEDPHRTVEGELLEVKYGMDKDGIFFASSLQKSNQAAEHRDACNQALDKVQLGEMSKEAKRIDEEQRRYHRKLQRVSEMESTVLSLRSEAEKIVDENCEGRDVMIQSCDEMLDWMNSNPDIPDENMADKLDELQELCGFIHKQIRDCK